MPKFRKKPVVIEAVLFEDSAAGRLALSDFMGTDYRVGPVFVPTLEGVMHANPGDWIIRGVKGEFYPCKPDIFEATYERVDGVSASQ